MCDKSIILVLFMILKIAVLVIPILLLFIKKVINDEKLSKGLFVLEIIIVLLLIGLKFTNSCLINSSNISSIHRVLNYDEENFVILNSFNNANVVRKIETSKIYKTKNNTNVYYFNNNSLPLSDKKILCNGKNLYMKNFGNSLTAASISLSTALNKNIDPIELLNNSIKYKSFDCEVGISIDSILQMIHDNYGISSYEIGYSQVFDKLSRGSAILAEVEYNENSLLNLTCSKGYIVIYNIDNSGKIKLLDPNNYEHDYICPEQTDGALSIIKSNINDEGYSLDELSKIINRYWIMGRN